MSSPEEVNGFFGGGQGLEPIVDIEVSLYKLLCVCTMLVCTFLGGTSKIIDDNGRRRAVAEDVNHHPILCDVLGDVIVSEPQKSQVVSVILSDEETMKHLLDDGGDGHRLFPEAYQDPY